MEQTEEKFIKKPTPHDNAIPRADLAADMANMQQDLAYYRAQLQQAEQMAAQTRHAITRTEGAISYLQMRLAPEEDAGSDEGAQVDDTTDDAAEDVTNC